MRVAVTGASGFIGTALLHALRAHGHAVVVLGRRPPAPGVEHRFADLTAPVGAGILDGVDALLHLAANTGDGGATPAQEIAFAQGLLAQAPQGCRVVFVSSQAASPAAPSGYGRTKAAIEVLVLARGGACVRPGLVYGPGAGGLYGTLESLLRRLPVLPALSWPAPVVQPVHVDDLAAALVRITVDGTAGVHAVAGAPVTFTAFLGRVARWRLGRRPMRVPVPVGALRGLLAIAGRMVGPALSPARLDSLLSLPSLDAQHAPDALGVPLRDLDAGLAPPHAARRSLLREASLLCRALLGAHAPPGLLRRYARALPRLGVSAGLDWPRCPRPALVAALDTPARRRAAIPGDLAWRSAIMARLAEAEPTLARGFLRTGATSRATVAATLASAALLEARSRVLRPLAWFWTPRP